MGPPSTDSEAGARVSFNAWWRTDTATGRIKRLRTRERMDVRKRVWMWMLACVDKLASEINAMSLRRSRQVE